MVSSWDNLQISDYLDLLHDDYEFVMHSSDEVSNMKTMDPDLIIKFMQSTNYEARRCIYENEDVLVEHRVAKFPIGDREAVILVHLKKMGFYLEQKQAPHFYNRKINTSYPKLVIVFQLDHSSSPTYPL
tara:strand:+ start:139 stop:525 length:387 start_codon:yes stop_codon:yes gene_type:complete